MFFKKQHIKKITDMLQLGFSLAKAEFKLRNEGSYLGVFWYLLYPATLFFVLLFIRNFAFAPNGIEYYPLYLILGIVMVNFFNQTLHASSMVIKNNSGLIKSVAINSEVLVISRVMQAIFSHLFEVLIIVAVMLFYHIPLIGILWYLLVFSCFIFFVTGASFLFAALGTYIGDLGNVWAVMSQIIFFVTPTFYRIEASTVHAAVNNYNPIFYFLTIARDATIYQTAPDLWMVAVILFLSIFSLAAGVAVFGIYKGKFAEFV